MTKVAIKSDKITSFGGIFHVMDVFSKLGLNQVIDSSLGQRGSTGTAFQYSDIISSLFYSYLCGADCLEDINTLIAQFSLSPKCTLPGADTVGRGLKELKEANVFTLVINPSTAESRRVNQQVQNYKTYLKNSHFGVEKFNFSLGLSFNFFCIDIIPDEPIFMFLLISNTSEF